MLPARSKTLKQSLAMPAPPIRLHIAFSPPVAFGGGVSRDWRVLKCTLLVGSLQLVGNHPTTVYPCGPEVSPDYPATLCVDPYFSCKSSNQLAGDPQGSCHMRSKCPNVRVEYRADCILFVSVMRDAIERFPFGQLCKEAPLRNCFPRPAEGDGPSKSVQEKLFLIRPYCSQSWNQACPELRRLELCECPTQPALGRPLDCDTLLVYRSVCVSVCSKMEDVDPGLGPVWRRGRRVQRRQLFQGGEEWRPGARVLAI
jgi:hypothetical protein